MLTDADLIKECKKYNPAAQKALYYRYAPVMKGLCIRYTNNGEDAKDILQEGFIKVFSNINSYSGTGSIEGWIKRIIVNTAISYYRKNSKHHFEDITTIKDNITEDEESELELYNITQEDLINSLSILPMGFRYVFNLFYIENHSHKDIANILSIDEKTSRTRLYRARKMLKEHFSELKEQHFSDKEFMNKGR